MAGRCAPMRVGVKKEKWQFYRQPRAIRTRRVERRAAARACRAPCCFYTRHKFLGARRAESSRARASQKVERAAGLSRNRPPLRNPLERKKIAAAYLHRHVHRASKELGPSSHCPEHNSQTGQHAAVAEPLWTAPQHSRSADDRPHATETHMPRTLKPARCLRIASKNHTAGHARASARAWAQGTNTSAVSAS